MVTAAKLDLAEARALAAYAARQRAQREAAALAGFLGAEEAALRARRASHALATRVEAQGRHQARTQWRAVSGTPLRVDVRA